MRVNRDQVLFARSFFVLLLSIGCVPNLQVSAAQANPETGIKTSSDDPIESIVEDIKHDNLPSAKKKINNLKGNQSDKRVLWAKGMLNRGDVSKSNKLFMKSCQKGYWLGCNGYAINAAEMGDNKTAGSMARKNDWKTPNLVYERLQQAYLFMLVQQHRRAKKHLDYVVSVDPDNAEALKLLDVIDQSKKKKSNKIKDSKNILEKHDNRLGY